MFIHTNRVTVELSVAKVPSGRRISAARPLLDLVRSMSENASVIHIRDIKRGLTESYPNLSVGQIRHALRELVRSGQLERHASGVYSLPGALDQTENDHERPLAADIPAPLVLRRAVERLPEHFCLLDVYQEAERMGSRCSETALRMAMTSAIREPEPYLVRVRRGVYRRVDHADDAG